MYYILNWVWPNMAFYLDWLFYREFSTKCAKLNAKNIHRSVNFYPFWIIFFVPLLKLFPFKRNLKSAYI